LLVIAEVVDVCTYVLKWNVSALTSNIHRGVRSLKFLNPTPLLNILRSDSDTF